ncbi:MAG: hypothetical protein ACRD8Z_09800 [Nitrososphaeraceae archaeon]
MVDQTFQNLNPPFLRVVVARAKILKDFSLPLFSNSIFVGIVSTRTYSGRTQEFAPLEPILECR